MTNKPKPNSQPPRGNQPQNPSSENVPSERVVSQTDLNSESKSFDPRSIGKPVYEKLQALKTSTTDSDKLKKQKSMAQEIYTYLSTWGLMRLKAEESILNDGREQPVKIFFECLEELSGKQGLAGEGGLNTLKNLDVAEYLGLSGLGLAIAREFSFWTSAVYHNVKGDD